MVFNQVLRRYFQLEAFAKELNLEVLGCVPGDDELEAYDSEGRTLLELPDSNPAVMGARDIWKKL